MKYWPVYIHFTTAYRKLHVHDYSRSFVQNKGQF